MQKTTHELRSLFACLPQTTRGMPIVIGEDPKGKTFLYCNGKSVIIRDIEDAGKADMYSQHSQQTTVAQYSPSGFYIASGDMGGKLRIWDTVNVEHILKNEYQPIGLQIKDIAWSPDSQRIAVGGKGNERFGAVIMADSGNTVGEIIGHSAALNSVSFKPSRPFRVVTSSEDKTIGFFHGPPFKFEKSINDHTNFVNVVRYSPNGDIFISGGADGKAFIYDGKTADHREGVSELKDGEKAHKGGIYALSFSPDGSEVLTASGDKTAKIWNSATGEKVVEFAMGSEVVNMQVGCFWSGDHIVTVSLAGHIIYLDRNNPGSPKKVIKGHNKPITAMTTSADKSQIISASSDGLICVWDAKTGICNEIKGNEICNEIKGKGHTNQIQSMTVDNDNLISVAMDDTLRISSISTHEYGAINKSLESQPRAVACGKGDLVAVACINHVILFRNGNQVFSDKLSGFEGVSVDIHPNQTNVAVGGSDARIHIYELSGDTLSELKSLAGMLGSPINDVKYSPDGNYFAAATTKNVILFDANDYSQLIKDEWIKHQSTIRSIAWSPDSTRVATGGIDTHVAVFTVGKKSDSYVISKAHPLNPVNAVAWIDDHTIVSASQDCCLRIWTITY